MLLLLLLLLCCLLLLRLSLSLLLLLLRLSLLLLLHGQLLSHLIWTILHSTLILRVRSSLGQLLLQVGWKIYTHGTLGLHSLQLGLSNVLLLLWHEHLTSWVPLLLHHRLLLSSGLLRGLLLHEGLLLWMQASGKRPLRHLLTTSKYLTMRLQMRHGMRIDSTWALHLHLGMHTAHHRTSRMAARHSTGSCHARVDLLWHPGARRLAHCWRTRVRADWLIHWHTVLLLHAMLLERHHSATIQSI